MDIAMEEVSIDTPVCGFVILRAGQLAVRADDYAVFVPRQNRQGFGVNKQIPRSNLELRLEASSGELIDSRQSYASFVVKSINLSTTESASAPDPSSAELATAKFVEEIRTRICVYQYVKLPSLEFGICTWCPGKVRVKHRANSTNWECKNHGQIPDEHVEKYATYPFLS